MKASLEPTLAGRPERVTPSAEVRANTTSAGVAPRPDRMSPEKPVRRRFTAEYKLRVLREADAWTNQLGALLRREGLYFSHLTDWRREREPGTLAALAPKKRGRPGRHPLGRRVAEFERENAQLKRPLRQAETIIEVEQKWLLSQKCFEVNGVGSKGASETQGIRLGLPGSRKEARGRCAW